MIWLEKNMMKSWYMIMLRPVLPACLSDYTTLGVSMKRRKLLHILSVHPWSFYPSVYHSSVSFTGSRKPIPGDFGWLGAHTAQIYIKKTFTLTFTPVGAIWTSQLACLWTVGGNQCTLRKPMQVERTQPDPVHPRWVVFRQMSQFALTLWFSNPESS